MAEMNEDAFTLDEGRVVLRWPAKMSPESHALLNDWLALMTRRVGRSVVRDPPEDVIPPGRLPGCVYAGCAIHGAHRHFPLGEPSHLIGEPVE